MHDRQSANALSSWLIGLRSLKNPFNESPDNTQQDLNNVESSVDVLRDAHIFNGNSDIAGSKVNALFLNHNWSSPIGNELGSYKPLSRKALVVDFRISFIFDGAYSIGSRHWPYVLGKYFGDNFCRSVNLAVAFFFGLVIQLSLMSQADPTVPWPGGPRLLCQLVHGGLLQEPLMVEVTLGTSPATLIRCTPNIGGSLLLNPVPELGYVRNEVVVAVVGSVVSGGGVVVSGGGVAVNGLAPLSFLSRTVAYATIHNLRTSYRTPLVAMALQDPLAESGGPGAGPSNNICKSIKDRSSTTQPLTKQLLTTSGYLKSHDQVCGEGRSEASGDEYGLSGDGGGVAKAYTLLRNFLKWNGVAPAVSQQQGSGPAPEAGFTSSSIWYEIWVNKLRNIMENGVVLDEEQLIFLAGGQDNVVDEDVDEPPVQDLALNVDNVFQADDYEAFDSEMDEAPTAQTMFMENLSLTDPIFNEASPSYESNIISEIPDHDTYQDAVCEHHDYVKDNAVPVIQSTVSSVSNDASMLIINEMSDSSPKCESVKEHNKVVDNSLTVELATYKEQVELYERRAKFELTEREQKINEQLRIVIADRNQKEENLKRELRSVKLQLLLYH
ncbi:hypothetical protein Tco_0612608 [Tanacetum coccineum]